MGFTLGNGWLKAEFSATCGRVSHVFSHPDQGTNDISDRLIFLKGHLGLEMECPVHFMEVGLSNLLNRGERICVVVTPSLAACSLLRFQKPLRIFQRLFWFKRALLPTHFFGGVQGATLSSRNVWGLRISGLQSSTFLLPVVYKFGEKKLAVSKNVLCPKNQAPFGT